MNLYKIWLYLSDFECLNLQESSYYKNSRNNIESRKSSDQRNSFFQLQFWSRVDRSRLTSPSDLRMNTEDIMTSELDSTVLCCRLSKEFISCWQPQINSWFLYNLLIFWILQILFFAEFHSRSLYPSGLDYPWGPFRRHIEQCQKWFHLKKQKWIIFVKKLDSKLSETTHWDQKKINWIRIRIKTTFDQLFYTFLL